MAKLAECKVCGKPYEVCLNCQRGASGYNWRRVACSPECGDIYLKRVIESRREKPVEETSQKKEKVEKTEAKTEDVKEVKEIKKTAKEKQPLSKKPFFH